MRWKFRSDAAPQKPADFSGWAEKLEISAPLADFLWHRGVHTFEDMRLFLSPMLRGLAPLHNWPGLEEAATVLTEGLLAGKQLCVWGDYDVDGITSAALIADFFERCGFPCRCHIPHRFKEGYGLNKNRLNTLAAEGVTMLLTVDSGISDIEAAAHAKSLGMTLVISDHHLPGEELPPADAIVNPRLSPCPCPALAGVGVAFFLAAACNAAFVRKGREKLDLRPLLDLVALGTLADVVDLGGQNRILVKNGLLKIAEGSRLGIAALKSASNYAPNAVLGAGQVVFTLAPRINAAGRLGSAETALELMLAKDRERAAELAAKLCDLNTKRREEEDLIFESALRQAEEQAAAGKKGLVLYSPDWHPGIIGIVASRVVEALHRPTVVLSAAESYLKGSGRSCAGFDLHEAFVSCSDLFITYGGHRMAAGLSLVRENLEEFHTRFNAIAAAHLGEESPKAEILLDGVLSFAQADFDFLKELEMLQPYGSGNAEPSFASPPVRVKSMRPRPGSLVLELEDEESGITLRAKAWRQLALMPLSLKGKRIRIAYTPHIDRYNGAAQIELRLRDWEEA